MRHLLIILALLLPATSFASSNQSLLNLHATVSVPGFAALIMFTLAYALVMTEEVTHLRKSKPVMVSAGLIWLLIAVYASHLGYAEKNTATLRHYILEYSELFLFLLSAMTFVNAMEERQVFEALRVWLVRKEFSYKQLFWVTGWMAFFISPIADNLTTALLMCAVVMAVGVDNPKFVSISCINIVLAANAGGAFSPFGDITTLMVWQKGILGFTDFFNIFIPSIIAYVVPALIMYRSIDNKKPKKIQTNVKMRFGAKRTVLLFLGTITLTVFSHSYFHLPPAVGMMTGLGIYMFFSYHVTQFEIKKIRSKKNGEDASYSHFDIFNKVKKAEWDTLLFFYGIVLSVGGLAVLGYLELVSQYFYDEMGSSLPLIHSATPANIMVGILSAIIDNIPVMFSVLTMNPDMSQGQWLLATLTAGIGGSILSVGSAAGVALMGQARGIYTFMSHLRWSLPIILGYGLSILSHILLNSALFYKPIVIAHS